MGSCSTWSTREDRRMNIEIDVSFGVSCGKCGADLDASMDHGYHGEKSLSVDPCEDCLGEAWEAGRKEAEE